MQLERILALLRGWYPAWESQLRAMSLDSQLLWLGVMLVFLWSAVSINRSVR